MALYRICSVCCKNDLPSSVTSVLGGFFPPSGAGVFEKFAKSASHYLDCKKFPPEYFAKKNGSGGIIDQHVCKACRGNLEAFVGIFENWLEMERVMQENLGEILRVMRGVEKDKLESFHAYQIIRTLIPSNRTPENAGSSGSNGSPPQCLDFEGFRQELEAKSPSTTGPRNADIDRSRTSRKAPSPSRRPPASASKRPFLNNTAGRIPATSSRRRQQCPVPASASGLLRPPTAPVTMKKQSIPVPGTSLAAGDGARDRERQENQSSATVFQNLAHSSSSPSAIGVTIKEDSPVASASSSAAALVPRVSESIPSGSGLLAREGQNSSSSVIIITIDDDDIEYVPPRQDREGSTKTKILKGIESRTPHQATASREPRPSTSNSAMVVNDGYVVLNEDERNSGQGLEAKKKRKLIDGKKRKSTPKKRRFRCKFCDDKFENSWALKFHLHREHSDEVELHRCTFCPESFVQPKDLQNHMTRHTNEKHFWCHTEGCDLEFVHRSRLEHHQRIHDKGLGGQYHSNSF